MTIINQDSANKGLDFYTNYINSREWKLKRREAIRRDNKQCQTCLSTEDIEVHHKTYQSQYQHALSKYIQI